MRYWKKYNFFFYDFTQCTARARHMRKQKEKTGSRNEKSKAGVGVVVTKSITGTIRAGWVRLPYAH